MSTGGDTILDHLRRIVDVFVGRRLDYLARYTAVAVAQNADGTLDVVPDDARVPSAQQVPYRSLPGVTYTVPAGARVLLGYAGGDPSRPFVDLWDAGAEVTRIVVGGSSLQLARTNDTADCGALYVSASGAITGYAAPGTPPSPPPGSTALPLSARITGSSLVRG